MGVVLGRIILFVHDVDGLAAFYRDALGLQTVESIAGEWVVLAAGPCELALHRVGPAYRDSGGDGLHDGGNAKVVLTVERNLAELRKELQARGAEMGEIKCFSSVPGPLCDGRDPEGNVFQLVQAV